MSSAKEVSSHTSQSLPSGREGQAGAQASQELQDRRQHTESMEECCQLACIPLLLQPYTAQDYLPRVDVTPVHYAQQSFISVMFQNPGHRPVLSDSLCHWPFAQLRIPLLRWFHLCQADKKTDKLVTFILFEIESLFVYTSG